jgi:hypothetical protein
MEPYKQIIVIFPRDKAGGSVNLVSFPFVKQCTEVTIRSLYLGSKGDGDKPLLSKMLNGEMVIRFDRPLSFPYATAAVFMVEGKQADCNWLE